MTCDLAFKFKQPSISFLSELKGALVLPHERSFCKFISIDHITNTVFYKGDEEDTIRWISSFTLHALFTRKSPSLESSVEDSIFVEVDVIRYVDVIYKNDSSYLLVVGKTDIKYYSIQMGTKLELLASISTEKRIKSSRSCHSSVSIYLAAITFEDGSVEVLSIEKPDCLTLLPISIKDTNIKYIDCWWMNADRLLLISPSSSLYAIFDLELEVVNLVEVVSFSNNSYEKSTYFQLISALTQNHYLGCIETDTKTRHLVVIDLIEGSVIAVDDPTFSLDIPENFPPYFQVVSIPFQIKDTSRTIDVYILFSSCSPDATIFHFNPDINSISISTPTEDEDLATLPMLTETSKTIFTDEIDTFCTGLIVDYNAPWILSNNDSDELTVQCPFLLCLNSVGWIIGFSIIFPPSLDYIPPFVSNSRHEGEIMSNITHGVKRQTSHPPQTLPANGDNSIIERTGQLFQSMPPDLQPHSSSFSQNTEVQSFNSSLSISSTPNEIQNIFSTKNTEPTANRVMPEISALDLNTVRDVLPHDPHTKLDFLLNPNLNQSTNEISIGKTNAKELDSDLSSLNLSKESTIYKILEPISKDIKGILEYTDANLKNWNDFSFMSKSITQKNLFDISSAILDNISSLKNGICQVKPLVSLVNDLQMVKRLSPEFPTNARGCQEIPLEHLLDKLYEKYSNEIFVLEKKIQILQNRLQVLQSTSNTDALLSWQERFRQLELRIASVGDSVNGLEAEMDSKLSITGKKNSFSFGLSEEDCIINVKQSEKETLLKATTIWDHLLTPIALKTKDNVVNRPISPFIDPSLEKIENNAEISKMPPPQEKSGLGSKNIYLESLKPNRSATIKDASLFSTPGQPLTPLATSADGLSHKPISDLSGGSNYISNFEFIPKPFEDFTFVPKLEDTLESTKATSLNDKKNFSNVIKVELNDKQKSNLFTLPEPIFSIKTEVQSETSNCSDTLFPGDFILPTLPNSKSSPTNKTLFSISISDSKDHNTSLSRSFVDNSITIESIESHICDPTKKNGQSNQPSYVDISEIPGEKIQLIEDSYKQDIEPDKNVKGNEMAKDESEKNQKIAILDNKSLAYDRIAEISNERHQQMTDTESANDLLTNSPSLSPKLLDNISLGDRTKPTSEKIIPNIFNLSPFNRDLTTNNEVGKTALNEFSFQPDKIFSENNNISFEPFQPTTSNISETSKKSIFSFSENAPALKAMSFPPSSFGKSSNDQVAFGTTSFAIPAFESTQFATPAFGSTSFGTFATSTQSNLSNFSSKSNFDPMSIPAVVPFTNSQTGTNLFSQISKSNTESSPFLSENLNGDLTLAPFIPSSDTNPVAPFSTDFTKPFQNQQFKSNNSASASFTKFRD